MSYSHGTDHSYSPDLDSWRSFEHFIEAFPYKQGNAGINQFLTSNEFITYYETKYHESFDIDYNERDVYGKPLTREYIANFVQRSYLDQMGSLQRNSISPNKIQREYNVIGRVVKFISNSISDSDKVLRFQHFFESTYYYLIDILNINPDLPVIRAHGLDDQMNAQFQTRWDRFKSKNGGLLQASDLLNGFNKICRVHSIPFVMFVFEDNCYVVHTTDIFVEKIIQELPIFLKNPDLQEANLIFIKAYTLRNEGSYKDCIAKIREGLESVRDYIFDRYSLTKSTSVYKDFEQLFNAHATTVFNFTIIPEDNPTKLDKIVNYLRDTVLLSIKIGNFGHHTLTRPNLLEENTSIFTLGLIASVIPYIIYLLK